jgi:tyrosyl-tRNA synthetase
MTTTALHSFPSAEEQFEILRRGAEEILPDGGLLERLRQARREGRPLRVKQGFDPTAPDIHLGHTVGLRKLREFQDLGHQVVLIIGDYTGMVGDPSGRSKTRPQLTEDEVRQHAKTYLDQFHRVVPKDPQPPRLPVEIRHNGEWFSRMAFMDVMKLASEYTVARVLERDDFAKRFKAGQPISIHELFYPLMQGYDSVAIRADVELGGTEQKFNLLVGRVLQELHGQVAQSIMTLPILPGLDGVQRMSKSLGNYIGVSEPPGEVYGKVMRLPDTALPIFWLLVAESTSEERQAVERDLGLGAGALSGAASEIRNASGAAWDSAKDATTNPMGVKKRLAHRLASMYHGAESADRAAADFEAQFSRREIPESLEEFGPTEIEAARGQAPKASIVEVIVGSGLAPSKSMARRLIEQGAVSVEGDRVTALDHSPSLGESFVLRVGRKMKRYVPGAPSTKA